MLSSTHQFPSINKISEQINGEEGHVSKHEKLIEKISHPQL